VRSYEESGGDDKNKLSCYKLSWLVNRDFCCAEQWLRRETYRVSTRTMYLSSNWGGN
jgi:hypothetical protein